MPHFDAIVVGVGGVVSATLWQLARRGMKVLGIDRYPPPHTHGSSHGQSRMIRQAYFEHPNYTPLVLESYRLWQELAEHTGRGLYHERGVLQIGAPDGEVVRGVLDAADQHNLALEQLSPQQIEHRWPALRVPEDLLGVFESRAGYLLVEQCVAAHLEAAIAAGAELCSPAVVQSWQPGPPAILQTTVGEFTADRLLISSGAWASSLLEDLQLDLTVLRKSMFWFPVHESHGRQIQQLPCFLYELPEGVFYGMPPIDQRGIKIAEHSCGQVVDDPLAVSRAVDPEDSQRVGDFIRQQLPALSPTYIEHSVCMYTMSDDGHFIVDRHPQHPHVVFAAGLSGHGFKFAPVLGQALADLVLTGETDLPIGFLQQR